MEEKTVPPLTAIDQIANGTDLLMLKAVIPYIPYTNQKFIALYVKIKELENLMSFYEDSSSPMQACTMGNTSSTPEDMLRDMSNYCNDSQRQTLDSYLNLISTMSMFETYKDLFANTNTGSDGNPMDIMKNMLSPEQQSMFDTYSELFDQE